MNLKQINEFRVAHGLTPLVAEATKPAKRRQDANRAARAQASRDLKSKRASRGK